MKYIASFPAEVQKKLKELRMTINKLAPAQKKKSVIVCLHLP